MSDDKPDAATLATMRADYSRARLRRADLRADPIAQFEAWLADAMHAQLTEPNAMSLATASADGRPLVRTIFAKGA